MSGDQFAHTMWAQVNGLIAFVGRIFIDKQQQWQKEETGKLEDTR